VTGKIKCWEFFECDETECPVYESRDLRCWLVSGTHCRDEIQGKFLEKIEMCLECEPFKANVDISSLEDTLTVVHEQFAEFRGMVDERDRDLEGISMELALGLSEVFEALQKISSGDPSVKISEKSDLDLITKLKHMVNLTGENLAEMVDLSHEFAIGLAEHFDALHRVSKGDLAARVSGSSQVELLESLKKVTNEMIDSVSREMTERKRAEEALQTAHHDLEIRVEERTAELTRANVLLKQEISERKRAEEALRDSEERYRTLFEDSRDAIYITARTGEFLDINQSGLDLFGYTREEMIGLDAREIYINPDDRPRFQKKIESKGSVTDYELKFRKKDKTEMDCLLTASVRHAKDGSVLGYQGIIRDITERKRLEAQKPNFSKPRKWKRLAPWPAALPMTSTTSSWAYREMCLYCLLKWMPRSRITNDCRTLKSRFKAEPNSPHTFLDMRGREDMRSSPLISTNSWEKPQRPLAEPKGR
jgi:PAS domain S-box-containing protein